MSEPGQRPAITLRSGLSWTTSRSMKKALRPVPEGRLHEAHHAFKGSTPQISRCFAAGAAPQPTSANRPDRVAGGWGGPARTLISAHDGSAPDEQGRETSQQNERSEHRAPPLAGLTLGR
ncbi:hypothetical protein D3C86_950710 [compost metagenome]